MIFLLLLFISFFVCSIPFGLVFGKYCKKIDPREYGSKNIGATNIARTCGTKYGILTLICDIGKGFLPVLIAKSYLPSILAISAIGLACICGHLFSFFLKGNGGKGVATTAGVYLALFSGSLLIAVILLVISVWLTDFVSIGSMILVAIVPISLLFQGCFVYLPLTCIIMILVFWRHQANIDRLIQGTEKHWRKNSLQKIK